MSLITKVFLFYNDEFNSNVETAVSKQKRKQYAEEECNAD